MQLKPIEEYETWLNEMLSSGKAVSVYMDCGDYEKQHQDHYNRMLGFTGKEKSHKVCTILHRIANMPGHYVVCGNGSNIACGLHLDIFYIDPEFFEDFE